LVFVTLLAFIVRSEKTQLYFILKIPSQLTLIKKILKSC